MKNFKIVLLPVILLGVASCVDAEPRSTTPTTPKISYSQQVINNAIGKPVTRLINQWGPPDRSFRTGGKEYLVYEVWTSGTYVTPGTSGYYGMSGTPSSSHQFRDRKSVV